MNFLAHIFLSGESSEMALGGFIADAVKGKALLKFPSLVQAGIRLHRDIDSFTDSHPIVKQMVADLKPLFGRYSVILPDLFFDHFLAADFRKHTNHSLLAYSFRFNALLIIRFWLLPVRIKRYVWHFILTNRLHRYKTIEGVAESLTIMVRGREIDLNVVEVIDHFTTHYTKYKAYFESFFPLLEDFAAQKRNE